MRNRAITDRTESKSCRQNSLSYLFIICHSERSEEPAFRRHPQHRQRQPIPHGKIPPFKMTTSFCDIEYSHRCLTAPSVPSYAVWISHCEAFHGSQPRSSETRSSVCAAG